MLSSLPEPLLFETEHWIIKQRPDAALPGYLLMSAKQNTTHLWELDAAALAEMGGHLARVQKLMMEVLKPTYLYIGRYGHMKGPSFHFHFIPIYVWREFCESPTPPQIKGLSVLEAMELLKNACSS